MIRLGTRRSPLALWQANHVAKLLEKEGIAVKIIPIVTFGDKETKKPLVAIGGKGLFLKEIEEALLRKEVDLGVHSLKDVPAALPEGLTLAGFIGREDPRDGFIGRDGKAFWDLPLGARIGTGSLRRAVQLLRLREDLKIIPLRGNVHTRLKKMEREKLDGIVLAMAGLKRLGLQDRVTYCFEPEELIPAVGQGVLGLEVREADEKIQGMLKKLLDPSLQRIIQGERTWLAILEGSCRIPMGAYCYPDQGGFKMISFLATPDGSRFLREEATGDDPMTVGKGCAEKLFKRGGKAILEAVETYPHPAS